MATADAARTTSTYLRTLTPERAPLAVFAFFLNEEIFVMRLLLLPLLLLLMLLMLLLLLPKTSCDWKEGEC